MILAKAPIRVSFFGGSSDLPEHFLKHGGATISLAIDKYVYVVVNHTPQNHIKLSYSRQECVKDVNDLEHDIVRETLKFFGIKSNIEITSFADIPTIGSGLGGSSAFTCALIVAITAYLGKEYIDPYLIATTACYIEITLCGNKIGYQDQYASAFGGMNYIKYLENGTTPVTKMNCNDIDQYMILIPSNIQRKANDILDKVDFGQKENVVKQLAEQANSVYVNMLFPEPNYYGRNLDLAWYTKKQVDENISNPEIDELYNRCKSAGSLGSKLLGAGSGGYMLSITKNKQKIKQEFSDRVCLDVGISHIGAKVMYRD